MKTIKITITPEIAMQISKDHIDEMRAWIGECLWRDIDEDDISSLTDEQVLRGIERHYSGGVECFIRDGVLLS